MNHEHERHVARHADGPQDVTPSTPSRLTYSVDEVAEILGISRSATYECIARGEIPAKRLGRRVVVVRSALEAFLVQPDSPNRPHLPTVRRLA